MNRDPDSWPEILAASVWFIVLSLEFGWQLTGMIAAMIG